jgi:hypothetical protein
LFNDFEKKYHSSDNCFNNSVLTPSVTNMILTLSVNSQSKNEKPFQIGVGAMIGIPVGDVSNIANLAFGADLKGEISVAPSFAITLSAG